MRVLVVDQDLDVLERVPGELDSEGFDVRIASSAERALRYLQQWLPHVAVIDVQVDLLAEVRDHDAEVHVLLTGVDDEEDRIAALRQGADDCVGRPCSAREIAARVLAVARRCERAVPPALDFGDLRIDCGARKVHVGNRVVEMPHREFDLLVHLASNPGRTFSREQLLRSVWNSSGEWQRTSTVTEHVRRIRQRIELDPLAPTWLVSVRGVGYRFEPGTEEPSAPTDRWRRSRGPVYDLRDNRRST